MINAAAKIMSRQIELAPFHEAGHVVAARYWGMEVVFADVLVHGNQCGLTRIIPFSFGYSKSTGLPTDKREAITGFGRHAYQLLAGPAAQAIHCYRAGVKTLNGYAPIQPEIYGLWLEFSKDEDFHIFDEDELTQAVAFFLVESGGGGDWQTILDSFEKLPYQHFDELDTHQKRVDLLHTLWFRAVEMLNSKWDDVTKIAGALKIHKKLTGDEIESLLV